MLTFKLFPNTLYCCFSVTVEGKLNSEGNPSNIAISAGEKYLSPNSPSTPTSPDSSRSLKTRSRSSLVPAAWMTLPVPSQYLRRMLSVFPPFKLSESVPT